MNSLYGKFGQKFFEDSTIISSTKYIELLMDKDWQERQKIKTITEVMPGVWEATGQVNCNSIG